MNYADTAAASIQKAFELANTNPTTTPTKEANDNLALRVQTLLEVAKLSFQIDAADDMRAAAIAQQVNRRPTITA